MTLFVGEGGEVLVEGLFFLILGGRGFMAYRSVTVVCCCGAARAVAVAVKAVRARSV